MKQRKQNNKLSITILKKVKIVRTINIVKQKITAEMQKKITIKNDWKHQNLITAI